MAKEFEMNMPQDVVHEYLLKSGYKHSLGNKQEIVFANLCATWGANQEYEAAHQYILGAVGEGNAQIYQEKRRHHHRVHLGPHDTFVLRRWMGHSLQDF